MNKNPLLELEKIGQSVWLDFISRKIIENNELRDLVKKDHITGVTSNPSIFAQAIAKTSDYDKAIAYLGERSDGDVMAVYEHLVIKDIQDAADVLRPTFEDARGTDGFVSLEVNPHLAHQTAATVKEARHLWHVVDRPNLMIKVPGTKEGVGAITQLIADGINVNVTLLFSIEAYCDAAYAYLAGLKKRSERSLPLSVHSVASFFVSRIDTKMDGLLAPLCQSSDEQVRTKAKGLLHTIAIANAKCAYRAFQQIYTSDLAKILKKEGARPQRLLWASTSTKNPQLSDVLYVEELVGKDTVNTMPPATLAAFRDHGKAQIRIDKGFEEAGRKLMELENLGIDYDAACAELLSEGIELFIKPFDLILNAIKEKMILKA